MRVLGASGARDRRTESGISEMKSRNLGRTAGTLLAAVCVWAMSAAAQQTPDVRASTQPAPDGSGAARSIPDGRIAALEAELAKREEGASLVSRRMACKSLVREAEALLEEFPAAPNRYRVLGSSSRARSDCSAWRTPSGIGRRFSIRAREWPRRRALVARLKGLDGQKLRIPQDLAGKMKGIVFVEPPEEESDRSICVSRLKDFARD